MPEIVVGYDGSPCSDAALRWALQEAKLRNARLLVISSVEHRRVPSQASSSAFADPPPEDLAAARRHVESALSRVAADAGQAELPEVEIEVPIGNAAASLISASRGADLIVVGSTGHNMWMKLLLGSVSTLVTQYAHCPVVVFRS